MGLPSRLLPPCVVQALEVIPSSFSSLTTAVPEPSSTNRWKICRMSLASLGFWISRRFSTSYPSGGTPPIHMPLRLLAAILSRMRSPVTSRSNWAKDSRMLSINRPIEVVVLNCWVTETKDTPWRSKTSTILEKSARLRVRRSIL